MHGKYQIDCWLGFPLYDDLMGFDCGYSQGKLQGIALFQTLFFYNLKKNS